MKVLKLVLGIFSIIFSGIVAMQSMLVGLGNTILENGETGGSGGIFLAILLLAGGIVMLATRKNSGKGGSVTCLILYLLGGIAGMGMAGSYTDLKIWSGFALIVAAVNFLALFGKKRAA